MADTDVPKLVITAAGLAAAVAHGTSGIQAKITMMALGEGAYTPTGLETTLLDEKHRQTINSEQTQGTTKIIACAFNTDDALTVREAGLILEDGTLFGIVSDPSILLAYKAAGSQNAYVQRLAVHLDVLPPGSIEVVVGPINFNLIVDNDFASVCTSIIKNAMGEVHIARRIYEITGEHV